MRHCGLSIFGRLLVYLEITVDKNEHEVLMALADAWNKFLALTGNRSDDVEEFRTAIHAAQSKIALRVARRVNPEVWAS